MDRHAGYAPVNVEHLDFVDIPYFGRERILAAERQPEKSAENRQILCVECVFAGPELAISCPLENSTASCDSETSSCV